MFRLVGSVAAVTLAITGCRTDAVRTLEAQRQALRQEAFRLYAAGDCTAARRLFGQGIARATQAADYRDLSRFQAGVGLCDMVDGHYSQALHQFQAARDSAARTPGADLYAAASANIAAVYGRIGDFENSKRALRDGLAAQPGRQLDAILRLNLAICHTEDGPPGQADTLLRDVIERLRAAGDQVQLPRALERLGYHLVKTGRLPEAEAPLREAIRIRQANQSREKEDSHFVLAWLRLRQGRFPEALDHLERYALGGTRLYWSGRVHNLRGEILEAAGRHAQALTEFRQAVDAMRRRRSHIRRSERLLRVSELAMPELYDNFIRLAAREYRRTGHSIHLAEAMAASEEVRIAFQREEFYTAERWAEENKAYRDLLSRLDALESEGGRRGDPALDRVHLEIAAHEARMAQAEPLLVPPPAHLPTHLARLRASVAADEAVFVFHVTRRSSLGWMVTRERVAAAELPEAGELQRLSAEFAKLIKTRDGSPHKSGAALFAKIFGEFFPAARTKLHWTLVLDGPLFEIPWAAIPLPPNGEDLARNRRPSLIDRFAVSVLPSFFPAEAAASPPEGAPANYMFAALGDPVYNSADPRHQGDANAANELARLPGSASEVRKAARVWSEHGYSSRLLLGERANLRELMGVVDLRPAVLHLATHVVSAPGDEARLALSLHRGRPELVGVRELAQMRLRGALVMMAGCASGRGAPQPVGLVGLTRAWLLSGAGGVVASLWPVPDDDGAFAQSFYARVSSLQKTLPVQEARRLAWARALREAILAARDASRLPATTWAGYYLMGRN